MNVIVKNEMVFSKECVFTLELEFVGFDLIIYFIEFHFKCLSYSLLQSLIHSHLLAYLVRILLLLQLFLIRYVNG